MQVILRKDIERLGKVGSCVKVKDGYARNYLLPRKLAFTALESNIKKVQQEIAKRQARKEKDLDKLRQLAGKLKGVSCTVVSQAIDEKKLYGSVGKENIKAALDTEGFNLDMKSIVLDEPIRELGVYDITITLHPEILASIKVWVVKK